MTLYLFDLDGTLISSYMDEPSRDFNKWSILPGRKERIANLVASGHQIGIVSNQAGVAWGFVTSEIVREKLQAVAAQLGYGTIAIYSDMGKGDHWLTGNESPITRRTLPIFVCYDKEGPHRKPNGAMIEQAINDAMIDYYDEETEAFQDVPVLFVGDRPEDEQAAAATDVPFQWAQEFFHAAH